MTDKDLTGEELLTAIVNSWWQKLIDYLPEETIKKRQIKTRACDYEWEGEHETDARYTYPNREKLIDAVLMKILEEHKPQEVDEELTEVLILAENMAMAIVDELDSDWTPEDLQRIRRAKQLLTQRRETKKGT